MRRSTFLRVSTLILLLGCVLFAQNLTGVRSIYVWPMQSSFDQYLAQEFAAQGVFRVVVDPLDADAILTEGIDEGFLNRMTEMFAKPEPEATDEEGEEEASGESIESGGFQMRQGRSTFGRSKGNLFLVGVKNRSVLWSTYLKEAEVSPDRLNQRARTVVERLQKTSSTSD